LRSVENVRGAARVLLVGLDTDAVGMVREVLAAEAVLPQSSLPFGDALIEARHSQPDAAIVSLGEAMDAALDFGAQLSREFPNMTLVAMARQSDASAILAAMRVGYKEFVTLPDDAQRLRDAVHASAIAASSDEKGLVVAVVGSKGGVGATTIATHLSAELAAIHRVVLLDFDFSMGDAASVLDVTIKDSVIDVLTRADRLDERSLTASVATHRSKVQILAQPNGVDSLTETDPDDVFNLLNACAQAYQYILVDVGSQVTAATALSLQVADIILLVTTPDVIAVRDAFRRVKLLQALGVENDRIRLLVNRHRPKTFVSLDDIQTNLGLRVSATIVDDPKTAEQATNEGKLIREVNRRSDAARNIAGLVALLTEEDNAEVAADPPSKGGLFGWFGRG
jgi:pilus assembly protein CpaE